MIHLGDITKIKGNEVPIVDCTIGGSPCQDLSMAGLRQGFDGKRSVLYKDQIRIIKEMREHDKRMGRSGVDIRPRYMVWENVPGAFSTNGGKDFAAVLEEAVRVAEPEAPSVSVPEKGWPTSGCLYDEMGNWSVAWRVLDAQFWGTSDKPLPQRRRRIALVADFGGLSAPEILFVRKSVSGDLEPGKPKGKENAGDAGDGAVGAVGCDVYNLATSGDKAVSLTTAANATGTGPTVMTVQDQINATDRHAVVYGISPFHSNCMKSDNPTSGYYEAETSRTLDALQCGYPGCNQGGMAVVQPVVDDLILDDQGGSQISVRDDGKCPTLRAETHGNLPCVIETYQKVTGPLMANSHPGSYTGQDAFSDMLVAGPVGTYQETGIGWWNETGVGATLRAMSGGDAMKANLVVAGVDCRNATEYPEMNGTLQSKPGGGFSLNCNQVVRVKHIVRRLTPLECERLQGYPDGWTLIGDPVEEEIADYVPVFDESKYIAPNPADFGLTEDDLNDYAPVDDEDSLDDEDAYDDNYLEYLNACAKARAKATKKVKVGSNKEVNYYYTDSNGKRRKVSDSARYKALGNSIALPPWKWVLKRLCACYERDATMASLFDGIGGFPLIWEQINGKGSCLWASEIDDFPIAVTKWRFGE